MIKICIPIQNYLLLRRKIKYAPDLESIKVFVDSSKSCSQLTRFGCYKSAINVNGDVGSYFVDRDNIPMKYIGEAYLNGAGKHFWLEREVFIY